MAEEELREVSIALAGQPNVGKSTVFNMLTGLNQHVGNWPGKTVERRTGTFVHDNVRVHIIDLPGTYCLTAASPEERIARDYIIRERPDVVIAILNAASLERNLYLVAELLALPVPIVIGLNMMDVAQQEGFEIEPAVLAAAIGVPVVPMVASRNEGVHELIDAALDVVPSPYPPDWVALKMLEGDQEITALMREVLPPEVWATVDGMLRKHEDAIIAVASGRYEWIRRMTRAALKRPRAGNITLTQRLDNVATHPFWGLVVLGIVLGVIFTLTYKIGGPLQEWLATYLVDKLAEAVQGALAGAPAWLSGLLVNGIIGGVGTVITFLPILAVFFAVMGLMEDIGYMARAAYVMDRFMHAIGLHGKSFMPLFLGFGCNVPAIMGARIIESERSRLLTILLAPLVPCTARLAVLAVLVPIFFPQQATIVSWALTALPLVVLALAGVTINKLILKGERSAFIMEMPLYHVPNWRTIGILVWQRLVAFLRKAGTIILLMSVLIWALSTLPMGEIEESYLAALGRFLAPLGAPMGLGWRPLVALLTSFVAKENAVATLGVLYGVGENSQALAQVLSSQFTSASALAFLVAEMLFIPCVSTLAVIKQEAGSWKWVLIDVGFLAVLTLLAGTIAYQLGALLL